MATTATITTTTTTSSSTNTPDNGTTTAAPAPTRTYSRRLTVDEKIRILGFINANPTVQQKYVIAWVKSEFNVDVNQPFVSKLVRNQSRYLGKPVSSLPLGRRRIQFAKNRQLEEELYEWYVKIRKHFTLSDRLMLEKAKSIAGDTAGVKLSQGWLRRFKERHMIYGYEAAGDAAMANFSVIQHTRQQLQETIKGLDLKRRMEEAADSQVPINMVIAKAENPIEEKSEPETANCTKEPVDCRPTERKEKVSYEEMIDCFGKVISYVKERDIGLAVDLKVIQAKVIHDMRPPEKVGPTHLADCFNKNPNDAPVIP